MCFLCRSSGSTDLVLNTEVRHALMLEVRTFLKTRVSWLLLLSLCRKMSAKTALQWTGSSSFVFSRLCASSYLVSSAWRYEIPQSPSQKTQKQIFEGFHSNMRKPGWCWRPAKQLVTNYKHTLKPLYYCALGTLTHHSHQIQTLEIRQSVTRPWIYRTPEFLMMKIIFLKTFWLI